MQAAMQTHQHALAGQGAKQGANHPDPHAMLLSFTCHATLGNAVWLLAYVAADMQGAMHTQQHSMAGHSAHQRQSTEPTCLDGDFHMPSLSRTCHAAAGASGGSCGGTTAQGRNPCAPISPGWQATVCGRGAEHRDALAISLFSNAMPLWKLLCSHGHVSATVGAWQR